MFASDSPVIWRISDGRPGHDTQSIGLTEALQRRLDCRAVTLPAQGPARALGYWFSGRYPTGMDRPRPSLIIGAGRRTHLDILAARRSYGGRGIVLMRPSPLLRRCFDMSLIPEHDQPRPAANVMTTKGAVNRMRPGHKQPAQGLMLIGGPSSHHDWNADEVIEALERIITADPGIHWIVTDSPRTPPATSRRLAGLPATEYHPHQECPPDWLAERLAETGPVWVSEDSISMVHEALTAGCLVGLLDAPRKQESDRVTRGIDNLIREGYVTPFAVWLQNRSLQQAPVRLQEADRCAAFIIKRFLSQKR